MGFNSLHKVTLQPRYLKDYFPESGDTVQKLYKGAEKLRGLRIAHVNATSLGGGVAEMLKSVVPLQNDLGFKASWYVIPPNDQFFQITKKIHNLLQGGDGELSEDEHKIYLDYNNKIAGLLAKIKTDILIIHDPQPAAALSFLNGQKPKICIWRCHIDTSTPNKEVWKFILPYLKIYDRYVFTMPEFAHNDFNREKLSFITPVIDPLAEKNKALDFNPAKRRLKRLGIDIKKPLITQISRLDPWKDPEGVVDVYRLAKKEIPDLQLALVAQMATDDPEGEVIYKRVKEYVGEEEGIFLFVNLKENDLEVNAFQVASDVIIQKSIREGFGLTVTEAMWKGAVVVAGNVGGIRLQIDDGVNGFLVNSAAQVAQRIIYILKNPKVKKRISLAAHQKVKDNFLTPHLLLKYLNLFNSLTNKERDGLYPTPSVI